MRVLVTGATGYVGSRLVSALLDGDADVVVGSRTPDRLRAFGWYDDVTSVALDAQQPQSIKQALADAGPVDVIYYLVHAIGQPDFRVTDNRAATNVAEAAREAGVKRIVYLGGFVPTDGTLSEHLAGRAEVAEALTVPGGPDVVWLGAAIIIGAGLGGLMAGNLLAVDNRHIRRLRVACYRTCSSKRRAKNESKGSNNTQF